VLKTFALPHPALAGVGVALFEIAVGLLTIFGLKTCIAAAAGLSLNLLLFATASWKDVSLLPGFGHRVRVRMAAIRACRCRWAAGARQSAGALAHLRQASADRRVRRPRVGHTRLPDPDVDRQPLVPATITRRALIAQALGLTGVATLVIGGISALAKGRYRSTTKSLASSSSASPAAPAAPLTTTGSAASGTQGGLPANAVRLGPSSQLPAGQAATYRDPGDGSADIVIRQPDGTLTALSAVCTHAGCTIGYESGQLVCPCHGATYDARTGVVQQGPAVDPLPRRRVIEHGGDLYALPI
jgi:thiosulfate dehydrogenase (quinone) large subunit